MSRSIASLVEEQARRWELRPRAGGGSRARGVVAFGGPPGAAVADVARGVSEVLGYDLFDREIIRQIAKSARLSERLVSALDEHDRSWLGDWLASFTSESWLSTYGYLQQLGRIVGAIARQGGAVIVGHGAHAMLDGGQALRVLVTAPLDDRVSRFAVASGLVIPVARERVMSEEAERRSFLEKHFHVGLTDPAAYDLALNTERLPVPVAVELVVAAARSQWRAEPAP